MKAGVKVLLDEIAEDFTQYLKSGNLNIGSFSKKIDPNLNIDNVEKLLKIHFVLTERRDKNEVGVIDFIDQLSERIRRIKTTVKKRTDLFKGEIKGRVCWKDTLNYRYNQNPKDKTLFICDRREKNYEISENLVLKRLLQVIHGIVYEDLRVAIEEKYEWVKGWTIEEEKLKEMLNRIFFRNVYLRRIDLTNIKITDRMISRAKRSRQPLYREAATLLSRYRKLMNYEFDPEEAKKLLENTFIKPEKIEVLFELYWVIKIIKDNFENPKFRLIVPGENVVAEWESGEYLYKIYHDSCGSFQFKESIRYLDEQLEDKDNYLGRELKVIEELERIAKKHLQDTLWGGRPDIILEKYDAEGKIVSLLIGEVKYTDDKAYAIQGLKELLEYIALIKESGRYRVKYENLFENLEKIRGCLFLDTIAEWDIEGEDNIQVVMFGEDSKKLERVIEGVKHESRS
jgi:hypothetical protein